MNSKEILRSTIKKDAFIKINKKLAILLGIQPAIYIATLLSKEEYFESCAKDQWDEWFYFTQESMENESFITPWEQSKAIKLLTYFQLIECKRKGTPGRNHYKINHDNITDILGKTVQELTEYKRINAKEIEEACTWKSQSKNEESKSLVILDEMTSDLTLNDLPFNPKSHIRYNNHNQIINDSKESYSDSKNLLSNKSPCGEIKLNRRKQETLLDSNVTLISIKQENIPATLSFQESTPPKTLSKTLSKVRQKIAEGQQPIVILPQKKEIIISPQMQEVLDYWKSEKLFISKDDTGTHRDGLKKLQDLFNGKLFKRKYTIDEIIGSISRFSIAVKDKDYYPISKKDYQKTNISAFISNPFAQEKSYFLKFLDESLPNPIAKQKENVYKTIVSILESRFEKEIKGGMETDETITKKIEKRNKIIDASIRLYNFCIKNKDRLGYMSQEEMANMLFDAVNDATSGNPKFFNINRLCLSDITWGENLPAFAFSKGYANDLVPQDIRPIFDYGYEDQPQPIPQDQDDDYDIFDEEDAVQELTEEQKAEQRTAQLEQQKAEAAFEERCRNRGAKLKEMPVSVPNGFRQRHGMLYDGPEDD